MTRALRALTALTLLAAPLVAQNPIGDRLLSMQGKAEPDQAGGCKVSGGDFHVSSAATYFSTALSTPVNDNKIRALLNGRDQARQGLQNGSGSSKAWYYLARIYLQQGDLPGADSALTHLTQLAPLCAAEAALYRGRAWSSLMTAAVAMQHANHPDSLVFYSRAANQIDGTRPQGWYTIGVHFLEAQQNDSAEAYMAKAFAAPTDTSEITVGVRQMAAFQYGVLAFNAHDYAEAARGFGLALRLKADDGDAKRNLAASLRKAGMADSAAKIEGQMMSAGVGTEAGLTSDQMFSIGVDQYNAHKYADAVTTFQRIIAAEPNNHEALYNLANSYLGLQNGDSLLATALRLQAIEPLNVEVFKLVNGGYQMKHDQASLMRSATAAAGATVTLSAAPGAFAPAADHATLTLTATGRDGRDVNDRAVRAAAIPIVVEFLNKDGAVVVTAEATVPALAANATQPLPVTGQGAGITAWRYHRK